MFQRMPNSRMLELMETQEQHSFENKTKNMDCCIACFKEHFDTIIKKAKPSLKQGMQSWLDYL